MNIITIEFQEQDAFRLLWLVQREAAEGKIWDRYWETLAGHIRENIIGDLEHLAQIEYQEALARKCKIGAVRQPAG
ncbi:MAG: hypothetical protein KJ077_05930 [Anaerolineae bacterium]|nr:hypothetical protein [Anaerolineae bacterium]